MPMQQSRGQMTVVAKEQKWLDPGVGGSIELPWSTGWRAACRDGIIAEGGALRDLDMQDVRMKDISCP